MQDVVIRSVQDVVRFVNEQPVSKSAKWIVLVALGGVFVDAYDFASLGIGVVQIQKEFSLTPFWVGSVTAMMALGAFVGALWGGYYTDKVGRYKMFLLDLIFLVVAAIGAALSVNLPMLLFFRFLMGVGVGLDFPVALAFIAEFINSRNRGRSVNLWQGMWYVAASCTGLITLPFYFLDFGEHLWRVAVGFGAVPALVILLLRYMLMDESPIWAASNDGLPEAGRILEKTYGIKVTVSEPVSAKRMPAADVNFWEIFSPKYRTRTILASIICVTQSLEYFAVGFNLPSISVKLFGSDFLYAILGAIFFNIFGIVGGFGGAFSTERIGVRRLAMIGYALVIISLLALWFGGESMPLVATALLLGLFVFGHSFGPGAQGMTMAALSFPTRIRGIGTGWGQGMVRVGSILGFYFFPLFVAAVGLRSMMLYLALVPLLGLIAVLAIAWEPADHDVEDPGSSGNNPLNAAPAAASMHDR